MGSAVDKQGITYNLEKFAESGIGGVHIIPVYGVKGYENKFIDFLSPQWMEMLSYTASECKRLSLGLDMTAGTGWPFGGPHVKTEFTSAGLISFTDTLSAGQRTEVNYKLAVKRKTKENSVVSVVAVSAFYNNKNNDITENVDSTGLLLWTSPADNCIITTLLSFSPVQEVKRPAPGGKGYTADPFSAESMTHYFASFDTAFKSYNGIMPRAFYHDSYEYYNADWTKKLPEEFEKRRGYKLQEKLAEFVSNDSSDIISRVRADYRAVIAELHEEYIKTAVDMAHQQHVLFRNQAHGSPSGLPDTYAAADIPETEAFGSPDAGLPGFADDTAFVRKEFVDPLILKFASSAAHVTGKNLVSSETGTWLSEHFRETLARVKPEADILFISGINHIFYHGIAYSPENEEWPGWLFYASTNFGPSNPFWRDIQALNSYITACQAVLREGRPDNDILLYYPISDTWHSSEHGLIKCEMHNPEKWLFGSKFYESAKMLYSSGFSFDYISDKQLQNIKADHNGISCAGNMYKAIVIPGCRFLPVETLKKLDAAAKAGANVIFMNDIPVDVPGFFNFRERQNELESIAAGLKKQPSSCLIIQDDSLSMVSALNSIGIKNEEMKKINLDFTRRKTNSGTNYFITNLRPAEINGWIELSRKAVSAVITDPLTGKRGRAAVKENANGNISVYVQAEAGHSLILTLSDNKTTVPPWVYLEKTSKKKEITGEWYVEFIEGGPVLPAPQKLKAPASWTSFNDSEAKRFAGTARYTIKFKKTGEAAGFRVLDLGRVCESARVKLNGRDLGTLWSFPYTVITDSLAEENTLEIEVTNMAANRIRDMDIRGVNWKKFYDINFVDINYKKFNSSSWKLVESGLPGPVTLQPAAVINP
jgi:hypothetical protein